MIRVLAILSVADLAIFPLAAVQPQWTALFAPAHVSLTLWALLAWRRWSADNKSPAAPAFPVGAAAGPAAILLFLLLKPWVWIERRTKRLTYNPAKRYKSYTPDPLTSLGALARILDERVRYPEANQIESLASILRHGELPARRQALETAVTSFEPRLSPLIATALTDKDQTIRALAAAAAAQISYNLAQRREELTARIALKNQVNDKFALFVLLADHGCHNVLLSGPQRARLRQEAAGWLGEVQRIIPSRDIRRKIVASLRAELSCAGQSPATAGQGSHQPLEAAA